MYLKASALGLRFDAYPADVEHIVSYPINYESIFISSASEFQHYPMLR